MDPLFFAQIIYFFIYLFIYIIYTITFFLSPKYVEKKKKKKKMQPTPRIWVFFSVRFGSVRFWFYLIWFDLILLGKWAFLQMDWKTSGLVPTMKMIIYLRRLPTSDFRPHLPFQWRSRTWDSTRPDSQLDSTRLGIIFIL